MSVGIAFQNDQYRPAVNHARMVDFTHCDALLADVRVSRVNFRRYPHEQSGRGADSLQS
jgi:hypothetical protein